MSRWSFIMGQITADSACSILLILQEEMLERFSLVKTEQAGTLKQVIALRYSEKEMEILLVCTPVSST